MIKQSGKARKPPTNASINQTFSTGPKGICTSFRARILKAGYNQLGGICQAGLYTNFVDKQVLSTFFVSNNKLFRKAR